VIRRLAHGFFANGCAVGAHRAAAAGPGGYERRARPGQPLLCGGRALADAQRLPLAGPAGRVGQLAHHVHALPALDRRGGVARVLAAVQQDDALHTLLVDSTTVRAHQHASGARKKTGRKPWAAAVAG
jgi:hypothetical protein